MRSLYAPQPISNRPVGLGFPHRAGRCRPGRTGFSSPGCRSCRDREGFVNRGWGPIAPGRGGTGGGLPQGQLSPRAPRPLIGRGWAGGGGHSANGIGARENAGMKAISLMYYKRKNRRARLIFSYWAAAPSEGCRWYARKQLHSSRYRIGGSSLSSQTRSRNRRGVKGVLSLCLSVPLLFGSFLGQLEARASCWCSVVSVVCVAS